MRANIPVDKLPAKALLEDWDWLTQKPYTLIAMNNFGDLFLQDQDGRIDFLQLEAGKILRIANSAQEFQEMTKERKNQQEWFFADLLTDLEHAGMALGYGQCFALKTPLVLGGEAKLENFEMTSILVHVSMMGQIHRQVKNLPPGTKIDKIEIG